LTSEPLVARWQAPKKSIIKNLRNAEFSLVFTD
jgi:hypothetical protein